MSKHGSLNLWVVFSYSLSRLYRLVCFLNRGLYELCDFAFNSLVVEICVLRISCLSFLVSRRCHQPFRGTIFSLPNSVVHSVSPCFIRYPWFMLSKILRNLFLLSFQDVRAYESDIPYRAYTLGSTPLASRIKMGVWGLCFFIVGYDFVRNDLFNIINMLSQNMQIPIA